MSPQKSFFKKCKHCKSVISLAELEANQYICPKCNGYFEVPSAVRVDMVADEGSFEERFNDVEFKNVIDFPGYTEKHEFEAEKAQMHDAVLTGRAKINGNPLYLGVMDSNFMMGSMGRTVGEKITRMMEAAAEEKVPLVLFTASGGARMQEGIMSLMQMGKTSGGVDKMNRAGVPYIVVLTNPTSGGVTASFAMLGDVILAEPKALVCFAGPRVVFETTHHALPEGFQSAEDIMKHGFIDGIVKREDMRDTLSRLLCFFETGRKNG